MPGILNNVVIPLIIILLKKIEITTEVGNNFQNARKLNRKLSMGMLNKLLNKTRAHWYFFVTFSTQNLYPSVSMSSDTTSAIIDAATIRQIGESTNGHKDIEPSCSEN